MMFSSTCSYNYIYIYIYILYIYIYIYNIYIGGVTVCVLLPTFYKSKSKYTGIKQIFEKKDNNNNNNNNNNIFEIIKKP